MTNFSHTFLFAFYFYVNASFSERWAWLFEGRLTLTHDKKLTKVFISLVKMFLKANFRLVIKNVSRAFNKKK